MYLRSYWSPDLFNALSPLIDPDNQRSDRIRIFGSTELWLFEALEDDSSSPVLCEFMYQSNCLWFHVGEFSRLIQSSAKQMLWLLIGPQSTLNGKQFSR